jgi:trimeric autotransporter adhesin
MSTKTTFKRIALVAVASLGFGVLTSVAPANAAAATATITNTTLTASGRVGNAVSITVNGTHAILAAGGAGVKHTLGVAAVTISQPAGSTVIPVLADNLSAGEWDAAATVTAGTSGAPALAVYEQDTANTDTTAISNASIATLSLTPTHVGTYVVRVWNETGTTTAASAALSGAESYKDFTITVSTGVASITTSVTNALSIISDGANSADTADGSWGSLVKVTLLDANSLPAALAIGEIVTVDPSGTGDVAAVNNTTVTSAEGAAYILTPADFTAGVAYLNIANATAEITYVSYVSGSVTQSSTHEFVAKDNADGRWTVAPTALSTGWNLTSGTAYTVPSISSVSYSVSAATTDFLATEYAGVRIFDEDGSITGLAGATYDRAVLAAGSFTIAVTELTAGGALYELSAAATDSDAAKGSQTLVVTTAVRDVVAAGVTVTPSAARVAVGGSTALTVTVKDQFGVAYANGRVTLSLSSAGRNGLQAAQSGTTSSTGQVTFTVTDTALATSTLTTDTVTITAFDENSSASPATAPVITWSSVATKTVALTSDNTTAGVAKLGAPVSAGIIQAGLAGPSATAGRKTISATVTDAASQLVTGQACTWTVAGTGAAILSTTATTYTDSTGVCTTSVYAWIAGTYTITATSGGISGTATQTFHNATPATVRTISATVNGNIVTAVVKDRFGNGVAGATVYAIATGGANIGGSLLVSTPTTDLTGSVSWVVTGSGSVKVTTINPAGTGLAPDQTTAAAGNHLGDVTTPVVFTATTVGTAATAETGVGASFSAAGVSSATVTVAADTSTADAATAAADAAAEATDAANAATDAANAAAEAADAATAAAQDAADAVAALATSVEAMVNALKRQITSLTNLVIKIQKKVRA